MSGLSAPMSKNGKVPKSQAIRKKKMLYAYSKNVITQAIIRTRNSQILKYAQPARKTSDGVGYRIRPVENDGKKLTAKQSKKIKEIEDFVYNTGNKYYEYRDNFPTFLTKLLYDLYTYDQINIERLFESDTKGDPGYYKLNHFNMTDGGTILIDKYPRSVDSPRQFAQVIDDKIVHKFNERSLTFETYWGNSNIHEFGYGYSPVEASMYHLSYFNDTEQFNARFFKQGGTTRGLLVIDSGDNQYSQVALDSLRRTWTSMKGINGAWKIPVMTAADAKFVNMTQSSKDMEFSEWLTYLINIESAIFQINPEEINFPNRGGATGRNSGATFESKNSTKDRNNASKDKGLTPILRFIERIINDKILRYVDEDYRFEFSLGDDGAELKQAELIKAQEDAGMELNEGRQKMGLERKDGYDIPGNATNWVQYQAIQSKGDSDSQQQLQQSRDYNKTNPGDNFAPNFKNKDNDNQDQNKDNNDQTP